MESEYERRIPYEMRGEMGWEFECNCNTFLPRLESRSV